ncbi:MAG: hypothetical protein ABIJ05_03630 [Patescibacteria group bacterium]
MNSELKVLKKIWENDEESHIKSIAEQAEFGIDYTRYLCNCLLKKGQIKPIKKRRDWYKITPKGKKELESRDLIKSKVFKKVKDTTEKVVYYFPKKLSTLDKSQPKADVPQKCILDRKKKAKQPQKRVRRKKRKHSTIKIIKAEERKLNLGQSITKAVSFLKRSIKNKEDKG